MKLLFEASEEENKEITPLEFAPLGTPGDASPPPGIPSEAGKEKKVRLKDLDDEEEQERRQEEQKKRERILRDAEETLRRSVVRSAEILDEARKQAEKLKEEAARQGRQEGLTQGKAEGERQAREEGEAAWQRKTEEFQKQIAAYVKEMDLARDKVLEEYLDDLKDISLAVAEKIIRVSLKDSSDVVRRMILAATEKLKKKAWVKIYVAQEERGMRLNGDRELLEELSRISDNVKIVAMEDAEQGTCIVEMPDEIIDASVSTQMENIRDILNNARL